MIEVLTQAEMEPPNGGGVSIAAPGDDDFVQQIGDKLAGLTLKQYVELVGYLKTQGVQFELKVI